MSKKVNEPVMFMESVHVDNIVHNTNDNSTVAINNTIKQSPSLPTISSHSKNDIEDNVHINKIKVSNVDDIWVNNVVDKYFLNANLTKNVNILDMKGSITSRIDRIEDLQRLRNIVYIMFLTVTLLTLVVFSLLYLGHYTRVMFGAPLIYLVTMPVLFFLKYKATVNVTKLANITVGLLFVMVGFMNIITGAIAQPSIIALLSVPSAALSLCKYNARLFWNISVFIFLIIIYVLHKVEYHFIDDETVDHHSEDVLIMLYIPIILWISLVLYCHSISSKFHLNQIKNILHELESEKNEADQSRQDMADYISRMSHEFRSPLHVIMNLNELALSDLPYNVEAAIKHVKNSINVIESLRRLVSDVLTFARSQHSGGIELLIEPVNIVDIINRIVSIQQELKNDNVEVIGNISPDIKWVFADGTRLFQILFNLVSNSMKFTEEGSVKIEVKRSSYDEIYELMSGENTLSKSYLTNSHSNISVLNNDNSNNNNKNSNNIENRNKNLRIITDNRYDGDANKSRISNSNDYLVFSVRDTGIGVNIEQLHRIFMPFVQADSTINRKYGGTGLGLSIVQQLVKSMKGCLWVTSQENTGFNFSFAADLPTCTTPISSPSISQMLSSRVRSNGTINKLRILVVDDSRLNLKVSKLLLKKLGIPKVETIDNGLDAIKYMTKSIELQNNVLNVDYKHNSNNENDNIIDIALIDLHMPTINGYEVCREIAAINKTVADWLPLIAFTADVNPSVYSDCQNAGFNSILTKPANRKDVERLLKDILPQIQSSTDWVVPSIT